MPQVTVRRPFTELDLHNYFRLDPRQIYSCFGDVDTNRRLALISWCDGRNERTVSGSESKPYFFQITVDLNQTKAIRIDGEVLEREKTALERKSSEPAMNFCRSLSSKR